MGIKKYLFLFVLFFFLASVYPLFPAESKLIKSARRSMDYMSYDQAIRFLQQALIENPKQKEARTHLAFANLKLGKFKEAIGSLKEELALFPDSLSALILLAYVYINQGQHEDAVSTCLDFKAALEALAKKDGLDLAQPRHLGIFSRKRKHFIDKVRAVDLNCCLPYYILGLNYEKSRDFKKADSYFQYALELGYDPVISHIHLIDIELLKEDWQKALNKAQQALEMEGPQADFYFLMGISFHHLGEEEKAIERFRKSIGLKPYRAEALENLAKIYIGQGKFKDAVPLLQKVLKMETVDQEVYSLIKHVTTADQKMLEAARIELSSTFIEELDLEYKYSFLTEIDDVVLGINTVALDFIKSGKIDTAMNWTKNFLDIHDLSPELNYNLAKLYELKNRPGNALKYAWRAKELREDYKDALDLVASIFFDLGDYSEAAKFYEKVIEFNPKDAMSHFNLGCVFFAMKSYEEAEVQWRKAISNEQIIKPAKNNATTSQEELQIDITVKAWPISFEAHKSLGHLYLHKGQKQKALEEFIKAIELEPQDPGPYFEVGKIFQELNDHKNAATYFDKYIYFGGNAEKVKK